MAKATITRLICNGCGSVTPIQRIKGRQRANGHIKHLWCYRCQDTVEHVEDNRRYV